MIIRVAYEPTAAPFTGTVAGGNLWDILEENLTSIFQFRSSPPALVVPKTTAAMTAIPAQMRGSWTTTDIRDLDSRYAATVATPIESQFNVYFVRGYFNDGTGPSNAVIGVSLGGTNIVVIFKDVIDSSGTGAVQMYVEQSTVVHEIGHALGFVNNGVPMVVAHQDVAHGAHTTNSNCVMNWANEGTTNLQSFVVKYLTTSSKVMWGQQVLDDARAISR